MSMRPTIEGQLLEGLLQQIQKQTSHLRLITWVLGVMVIFTVGAIIAGFFIVSNLRETDLRQLAEARANVRFVGANGDLRGCRHDEEQDFTLARLLILSTNFLVPPGVPLSKKEEHLRSEFTSTAAYYRRGRNCHNLPSLQTISKSKRDILLRTYPPVTKSPIDG